MVVIEHAHEGHIGGLVDLGSALFAEDAGRHDTFVDNTWPQREGRADFERLVSDTSGIVLVVHDDGHVVGFLDGFRTYERHGFVSRSISRVLAL